MIVFIARGTNFKTSNVILHPSKLGDPNRGNNNFKTSNVILHHICWLWFKDNIVHFKTSNVILHQDYGLEMAEVYGFQDIKCYSSSINFSY